MPNYSKAAKQGHTQHSDANHRPHPVPVEVCDVELGQGSAGTEQADPRLPVDVQVPVHHPKPPVTGHPEACYNPAPSEDELMLRASLEPPLNKWKASVIQAVDMRAHDGKVPKGGIGARAQAAASLIYQERLEEAEQKLPGCTKGLEKHKHHPASAEPMHQAESEAAKAVTASEQ
ncbi:hypothetical protein WJX72_012333 [[Myrmecia] bisecta]|uniref:Uncharacterized protein n=1 Tax=[Myrmecia] bisecta TaxID=41462 RepID=A0AAW1QGN5_9CHLO